MIETAIKNLIEYAVFCELIGKEDKIYCTNRLLEILRLDEYEEPKEITETELQLILDEILKFAIKKQIISDNVTERDLFDTKVMATFTPRPSQVIEKFWDKYKISPKKATDYFYKLCKDTDYIRRYRIKRDIKWVTSSEYGDIDITVNLSKPEKDPKAIAAAKNSKQVGYPKCLLCKENEGYAGRLNHPARQNHRAIPLKLDGEEWYLQYSPYVYYNEHCIVLNSKHTPMEINVSTFKKLLEFVKAFPHYFIGSNADLPIVGGSILSHDHFQGGNYTFAMAKAPIETEIGFNGFDNVKAGIVKWPMSVIRLRSTDDKALAELADKILVKWRGYSDEAAFIFAETEGVPHNTITPIARKNGENFELDLVLRNNITTDEHPLGVYHPHAELHHIKKENIGLIEVMGLAVLPARLESEMNMLKVRLLEGLDLKTDELTKKHADWAEAFIKRYDNINAHNVDDIIKSEIGDVFVKVLEHAGVFKREDQGKAAFLRFVDFVNS